MMRTRSSSALFTAAALALLSLQYSSDVFAFDTSTSMRVYPQDGSVDFCFSPDCSAASPSLTIMPRALLRDTILDYAARNVASSTTLADFTTVEAADPWLTPPAYNYSATTYNSVMYARSCFTGCAPTPSTEYGYALTYALYDTVGMKLEYAQHGQQEYMQSAYETYTVPSGALTMNMSFSLSPAIGGNTSINYFAVSFLILATDSNGVPTTNWSINSFPDGKMYLARVYLGSQMYLDLPWYSTVDGADTMISYAVTGHTSGELQDLIEVTLVFPSVQSEINYAFGASSDALRYTTPSPSSVPPSSMPPSSSSPSPSPAPLPTTTPPTPLPNSTVPLMVLGSRGEFSLCGEADCSNGVVSMGFSGLASNSTNVKRFAYSPAFIFDAPQTSVVGGGVQKYTSQFSAYVPQSRLRPLRPATSGVSSDAVFSAYVDQYSDPIELPYGGTAITVPKGAIKYAIYITQWQFASTNEVLRLNMSIKMQDGQNNSLGADISNATVTTRGNSKWLSISNSKELELPLYALVDGISKPIQIDFVVTPLSASPPVYGYTIAFTFPMFSTSLLYDPVLRAVPVNNATQARFPSDHSKKSGSWVLAVILLIFLALIVVVTLILCTKKVKIKLDFSKIIP